MIFKNIAFGLASLTAVARAGLISPAPLAGRGLFDLVCPPGYAPAPLNPNTVAVVICPQVVVYPVVINTYITENTVINIIGGINIIINNAPTSISTTVTATVTETATSTVTATATATATVATTVSNPVTVTASPTSTALPGAFVLGIAPAARKKRAVSGLIASGGSSTDSCTVASKFDIIDGELVSNGAYLSTNVGVASAPFALSANKGSISRTFTSVGNKLSWSNGNFTGGVALFCIGTDGVVLVIFDDVFPMGCVATELDVIATSDCPGAISSSSVPSSTATINTSSGTSTAVTIGTLTSSSASSTGTGSISTSTETSSSSSAATDTSSSTSIATTTSSETTTTTSSSSTSTAPTATPSACTTVDVTFLVQRYPPVDWSVYIAGSLQELGQWNVYSAPVMLQAPGYNADYPLWNLTINFPARVPLEFKFLEAKDADKSQNAYEDIASNRIYTVPNAAWNCSVTLNYVWGQA